MKKESDKSDQEGKKRDPVEITIYTFYRPPGSETTIRADMPIDILRIDRHVFKMEEI